MDKAESMQMKVSQPFLEDVKFDLSVGYYGSGNSAQQDNSDKSYECEEMLYKRMSKEITDEAARIAEDVKMIEKYRNVLKNKIQSIAIKTFPNCEEEPKAIFFGSVVTGLALPESDMDIVITGISWEGESYIKKRNLDYLYDSIGVSFDPKVLIDKNYIRSTTVPVIKLTFDLSECLKDREYSSELPYVDFDNVNPSLRKLKVDISLDDKSMVDDHKGMRAADFIQNKLINYPILLPVWLILKKILLKNNINDPFKGGLGSFGLFCMLYSSYFLEKMYYPAYCSEETHPARLLAWFWTYFGGYFNQENMAIIFMRNDMPLVILKECWGADKRNLDNGKPILTVFDPLDSTNNITLKTFKPDVLENVFHETKDKIFNEFMNIYMSDESDNETNILNTLI